MGRTYLHLPGGRTSVFDSVSSVAIRSALDALATRQRVIADNIANVQTPGFLAGRVTFEAALADAVRGGSGRAEATVSRSLEPTREDGNNVNLDHEVLANIDAGLRYQLAVRAADGEFSQVRAVLRAV
jgi:flagellar basal-body rod protein FlgB